MKSLGVAVLFGAAFLLSSCAQEGALDGAGEKVAVNISLGDVAYRGHETVMRGDNSAAEAVRVPLGDGVYMFATLEEDLEAPTRAGIPLEEGAKVRVVAYDGSTIESTTEYEVTGGALVSATALEVSLGTTYTFVAYSYNNGTSPDYPTIPATEITVAPPHDLLWGSVSKPISASDHSVQITMSHQFAQVRVKARTTFVSGRPAIMNMSGVTVTPGNAVDLTIETGAVAKNVAAATQAVSAWSAFNDSVVTSDPILVYTGTANPIYVKIGSVTIAGYNPFTNAQAEFKKALAAGTSYTLVVNFQKTLWAKSNVYWKWNDTSNHNLGGYLTFDTEENGHEGYQGLVFPFGTLVGVSPVGNFPSYNSSVPIYAAGRSMPTTYAALNSELGYFPVSNVSNGTVSGYDLLHLRGDICYYINSDYRLPNSVDFDVAGSWGQNGWERVDGNFGAVTTSEDDGTYDFIANGISYARNTEMGVCLPFSGYRICYIYNSAVPITNVGIEGFYWGSRRYSTTSPYFRVNADGAGTSGGVYDPEGCFVRCIHN
jgi:hypothetical protein